jgi:hypothetical protein
MPPTMLLGQAPNNAVGTSSAVGRRKAYLFENPSRLMKGFFYVHLKEGIFMPMLYIIDFLFLF